MPDTPRLVDHRGEPLVLAEKADPLVSSPNAADPLAIAQYGNRGKAEAALKEKALQYGLYKSHPAVYAGVEMIVQTASREALRYSDATHEAVPYLEAVFKQINPEQNLQQMLTETYRDIAITGEAFWLKQRLRGKFVGARKLSNVVTYMVQDKSGHPDHVEQKFPGVSKKVSYSLDDILFFRLSDPESEVRGLSPLVILDLIVSSDLEAQKTFLALFRNGMTGNKILGMPPSNATVMERNRQALKASYSRTENAFVPMLVEGDVKLVDKGDMHGLDMPFMNGRKLTRQEVLAVLSVPYSKLYPDEKGALGQAGKEADDVTLKGDTIAPLQTMVANTINRGLFVDEFHLTDLELTSPAEQNARLDRIDIAEAATRCGLTGNEIRTLILALPPSDAAGMDEPLYLVRGVTMASETAGPETVTPQEAVDDEDGSTDPELEPSPTRRPRAPVQPAQKARRGLLRFVSRQKAQSKRDLAVLAAASVQKKTASTGAKLRQLVADYSAGTLTSTTLDRAVRRAQQENLAHAAGQAQRVTGQETDAPDAEDSVQRVLAVAEKGKRGDASPKQAAAWAAAEAGAAWHAYTVLLAGGMGEETLTWRVDPAADSCGECPEHEGETHPASEWAVFPGDLECGFMCRCSLEPEGEPAAESEAA